MSAQAPLIQVADYKEWHGLTTTSAALDGVVKAEIASVTEEIAALCRRIFTKGAITDEAHDGNDSRVLRLRRPPIWSVTQVRLMEGTTVLEVVDPTSYVIESKADDPNGDPNDGRVTMIARTPFGMGAFPAGQRNVLVSYVGGFEPIPSPILDACRIMVAESYLNRGKDMRVRTESGSGVARDVRAQNAKGIPPLAYRKLTPYILPQHRAVHGLGYKPYRRRFITTEVA